MSSCDFFIAKCLIGEQSFGHPRKSKKAIGWKIYYLKGISPFIFTHHIHIEEESKPMRQPQR